MADSKTSTDESSSSSMDPRFAFVERAASGLLEGVGSGSGGGRGGSSRISELSDREEIRSFLDDAFCRVLRVAVSSNATATFQVSNTLDGGSGDNNDGRSVSFVKVGVRPLTPDNMSSEVMVTSHGANQTPLRNLYSAVHNLYAPTLLNNDRWSVQLGDKLQELLAKLDTSLGAVVNNENGGSENGHGGGGGGGSSDGGRSGGGYGDDGGADELYGSPTSILSVSDEFDFWSEQTTTGTGRVRTAATRFRDALEPISTRWSNLEDPSSTMKLSQVLDLLEDTQNCFDDVWKVDGLSRDQKYPQHRMEHMFGVVAGRIGRYVQEVLAKHDVFRGPFAPVRAGLRDSVRACAKWTQATKELTGTFWAQHEDHPWRGGGQEPHTDDYLVGFGKRLAEIGRLRTTYEELRQLLTSSEQEQLRVKDTFVPFDGHKPLRYSAYTQPRWRSAVATYEDLLAPIERHIAGNLQKKMSKLANRPQVLLREFQKFRNLIGRPNIGSVLTSERQTLLAQLTTHVEQLEGDFEARTSGGRGASPPKGRNTSHKVNCVVWGKQLRNKVTNLLKTATPLLKDLGRSFEEFKDMTDSFIDKVGKWVKDRVVDWDREMQDSLEDKQLSVRVSGRLMEIETRSGNMVVNYSEALVQLLRDVRQLRGMSFNVSRNIAQAALEGEKYYRYGVALKKVANFYNTMDRQIIPSTKAMLKRSLLEFDKRVKSRGGRGEEITWSNPSDCEEYVMSLQKGAEVLSLENRRLRRVHMSMVEEVIALMSIDLLRQKTRWKARWNSMRSFKKKLSENYEEKDLENFFKHWDHQVYKALESSYRMGLESLNENLPEIKCELVFSSRTVQFRPPLEEVR